MQHIPFKAEKHRIEHVGMEWMDGVEAVACDMNSDFQEAFEEMCPHIQSVFDHFHIVKNYNDKVIVKEKLAIAYELTDEAKMASEISDIMDLCEASGNIHLKWFRRLHYNHFEGIIAHATYHISTGKLEDLNNKIKTVRRQGTAIPTTIISSLNSSMQAGGNHRQSPSSHNKNDRPCFPPTILISVALMLLYRTPQAFPWMMLRLERSPADSAEYSSTESA